MQTLSKMELVPTSCIEYVHPWTDSCWNATAGLLVQSSLESFRIYTVVYVVRFHSNCYYFIIILIRISIFF